MNHRLYSDNNSQAPISINEMFKISNEISRNYSPVAPLVTSIKKVNLPLSTQELQEVSDNISLYYSPKAISNNTNLALLAIDPIHVHVYWNLANNQTNLLLQTMKDNKLVLRIYSQLAQDEVQAQSKPLFETPIHNIQFQQQIKVPKPKKQTVYSAYIGKCLSENNFISLVKSNDLHIDTTNTANSEKRSTIFKDNTPTKLMNIHQFHSTNSHYASTNKSGKRDNKHDYA